MSKGPDAARPSDFRDVSMSGAAAAPLSTSETERPNDGRLSKIGTHGA